MTTYTDADVARLVKAASDLDEQLARSVLLSTTMTTLFQTMHEALAPFQPDPEAALIEQMCEAFYQPNDWHGCTDSYKDEVRTGIRQALAVVKERGLPVDEPEGEAKQP